MSEFRFHAFDRIRVDLRQAVRAAIRRPAFAIVTVLTLTIGVGANTAVSGSGTMHARLTAPKDIVAPGIREMMRALDPNLSIYDVELVSESLDRYLAEPRLLASTLAPAKRAPRIDVVKELR